MAAISLFPSWPAASLHFALRILSSARTGVRRLQADWPATHAQEDSFLPVATIGRDKGRVIREEGDPVINPLQRLQMGLNPFRDGLLAGLLRFECLASATAASS